MTCWSLVLYRMLAVACWWAALCLIVAAFTTEELGASLAWFCAAVLVMAAGIGLWKGERT